MGMDMVLKDAKARLALGKLSKIASFKGKQLLTKFFECELPRLREKSTVQDLIRSTALPQSQVNEFAVLISGNEKDAKLFEESIKLITNHSSTKRNGLFYKTIYQNGLSIDQKDYSKVKAFLLAKNDTDIVGDEEVDDADKQYRRKKNSNIFEKLQSSNMLSILKTFIALILWRYIQLRRKSEEDEIKKELVTSATVHVRPKYDDFCDIYSIDPHTVSRGQKQAVEDVIEHCRKSNSPFFELGENDAHTQYYLNSYLLRNGKNHGEKTALCPQLIPGWKQLKVNSTFEIDKYVLCNLKTYDLSKMKNTKAVFKIEISRSNKVLSQSHYTFIPPHTTFKVIKIEPDTEYKCDQDDDELISPKILKIPTLTMQILKQKDPVLPPENKLEEMIVASYTKSKNAQEDTWKDLISKPPDVVPKTLDNTWLGPMLNNPHFRPELIVIRPQPSTAQTNYLDLLADLQRQKMSDDDIEALYIYTGRADAPAPVHAKMDELFTKIKPLTRSLVVFRTMDVDEFNAIHQSYLEGKPFSYPPKNEQSGSTHLSTSVDPICALQYLQGIVTQAKGPGLLKLTIPSGKKALVAEPTATSSTGNREIVLQRRGLSIKVDKETQTDKLLFIEATVL